MDGLANGRDGTMVAGVADALMRNLFPCRLVERDGAVVGCWFVTSLSWGSPEAGAADGRDARVFLVGAMRTADGRVVGVTEANALGTGLRLDALRELTIASRETMTDRRRAAETRFVTALLAMLRFVARSSDTRAPVPFPAAMAKAVVDTLGWMPDRSDLDAAARAWAHDASGKIRRFLGTLDPWALRLAAGREDLRDVLGPAWPGLDRTFDGQAPLRVAFDANPGRIRPALEGWPTEAGALRAAIADGRLADWLDGVVVARGLVEAGSLPLLASAEQALADVATQAARRRSGHGPDAPSLVRRAEALRPPDRPGDDAAWQAFAILAPVFDEVAGWRTMAAPSNILLGAGADWPGRLAILVEAGRDDDPAVPMGNLPRMCSAFASQVLMPSVAIARTRAPDVRHATWQAWSNAARSILLNGRSLPTMLRMTADWMRPGTFGPNLPRASACAGDVGWLHYLPDAKYHRCWIHVLGGSHELFEDLRGLQPEDSGLAHHDALCLMDDCARGRSRAVSVRVQDAGEVWRTVAVLGLSLDRVPFAVTSRTDRFGQGAHPDVANAMTRYFRDVRSGKLATAAVERPALRTPPRLESLCGFDPMDRQAWDAAVRSWDAFLPERLRAGQPWQFARLIGRYMRPGAPQWDGHLRLPRLASEPPRGHAPCAMLGPGQ